MIYDNNYFKENGILSNKIRTLLIKETYDYNFSIIKCFYFYSLVIIFGYDKLH